MGRVGRFLDYISENPWRLGLTATAMMAMQIAVLWIGRPEVN
jgi:hypothetical protein